MVRINLPPPKILHHLIRLFSSTAWFRAALNELFELFQQILLKAERASITCAVSAVALLLAVLSTNAFTSRQRRVVVKVYSSN